MRPKFAFVALGLAALVASFALQGAAVAQAPAQPPPVGATVKDKKGVVLGVVVRTISEPGGKPYQVLVRQGQVVRPLTVEGLTPRDGAYHSPLSKAEFEIIPVFEDAG